MNNYITEEVYNQLSDTDKAGYKPQWEWQSIYNSSIGWTKARSEKYSQHQHSYESYSKSLYQASQKTVETRLVYIPIHPTHKTNSPGDSTSILAKQKEAFQTWENEEQRNGRFINEDQQDGFYSGFLAGYFERNAPDIINPTPGREPEEQASNYGDLAGVKAAEEIIEKHAIYHDGEFWLDGEKSLSAMHEYRTQTLNAVRGIIEADAKNNYSEEIREYCNGLLTEMNKLQP